MNFALLLCVGIIATCGLVYELVAGTLASYLLGDSVTQFSLIIGIYLFSMGIGSYLSQFVQKKVITTFVKVELLIGLVGGLSSTILFVSFEMIQGFRILLYFLVMLTGTLVGLEIPLLMRILKGHLPFNQLVSQVFTFDYIGALFASLLFPLLLVPHVGLVRTSFIFGLLNLAVGYWTIHLLKEKLPNARRLKLQTLVLAGILLTGALGSQKIIRFSESLSYPDPIVLSKQGKYQKMVVTANHRELRLFLNGNLQFSSLDEYRYHEALVHPGLAQLNDAKDILILGGGDGLAVREVLKYPSVSHIHLVDLDPLMTTLFSTHPMLTKLNENSLSSPKVTITNEDAFIWLKDTDKQYDFVIIDFPDPSNYSLGKLYSTTFFRKLKRVLRPHSLVAIQSTSPYFARKSYWCVGTTLEQVGFKIYPYHAYVPSFGDWGYFLASTGPLDFKYQLPAQLKFLSPETLSRLFEFPKDMQRFPTEPNKLNNQILVRYFEDEWSKAN